MTDTDTRAACQVGRPDQVDFGHMPAGVCELTLPAGWTSDVAEPLNPLDSALTIAVTPKTGYATEGSRTSTVLGLARNLTAEEMVASLPAVRLVLEEHGDPDLERFMAERSSPERIDRVTDALLESATADEFLARVRRAGAC